jgi:hypothetical protein
MINHLRTLLLNSRNSLVEFEEPVDPDFVPWQMNGPELVWQRGLVPVTFPARTRNFLATLWRNIAAQHPSYDEVLRIDPRELITFDPAASILTGGVTVTRTSGGEKVRVSGMLVPRPDTGMFSRTWVVNGVDGSTIRVTNPVTMEFHDRDVTFNSDCSSVVEIGDGLTLRVVGETSVPSFNIEVSAFAPFSFDPFTIVRNLRTASSITSIFHLKDKKLGRLLLGDFFNSKLPHMSLGAAAIAGVIHMTERRGL